MKNRLVGLRRLQSGWGGEGSGEVEDKRSLLEKNLIVISNPLYANLNNTETSKDLYGRGGL